MIAAWVIKKPRKAHKCIDCHSLMTGPHLRLFGGEDVYAKPWAGRWCFTCVRHSNEPQIRKALKEHICEKMEADPHCPRTTILVQLLADWEALVPGNISSHHH